MKKYFIIVLVLIITVVGLIMKHQYDVKKEEKALFEKAKSKMTEYLRSEYKGIEKISYDDYFIDPTGGITVEGYLNGDKTKEFDGLYDPVGDKIGSSSLDAEEKS
ncbi:MULTISPECIES: DUF1433 domain-containing protein [Bacillus]|uniref:DUF1433 domain-containing protein n=1 Tax=Bacillus velezensis TaxID=492670 RepID=A0ABC8DD15_BACVE|nr:MULTISPECIES: DUF1433 domain-containing protein [Bacillus]AJC26001.1 hypothetical protein SB24_12865 [Bacillus sp. Pc3]AMQ69187.1 hypothetical protein BAMY6639_07895 [Bacillus amyloliquefaciens UMAF6639]AMR51804.1 hypothetical protein A1R12_16110 [Bacillus amyloliquefaciens]ANB48095.1 hypothetical protein A1D33_012380 [Bacillus velezensis]AQP96845.1 DUF1433 domain-containing protein [Bacillus sp. 275]